ncbi:MAG: hypothetical protein ACFB0B_21585 [Thermonemataceae bacterium]
MSRKRLIQIGILFITLIVPIFIFIFIKSFGSNQYGLPFEGQKIVDAQGDTIYYQVPSTTLTDVQGKKVQLSTGQIWIVFQSPTASNNQKLLKALKRIEEKHNKQNIQYISLETIKSDVSLNEDKAFYHSIPIEAGSLIISEYLLEDNQQIALVDDEGHIRGLYTAKDMASVDELILEITILDQIYRQRS